MDTEFIIRVIADGAVVPIVLIGAWALIFYTPKESRYQDYSKVLMAGLTAFLFAKLIGFVYQPAVVRPFQELGVDAGASFLDNPGFPSDHMLFTTAIVLAVWFITKNKTATIILALLAVLVGLGRVLALVHTPLDIIGGVAIACLGALWYLQPENAKKSTSEE